MMNTFFLELMPSISVSVCEHLVDDPVSNVSSTRLGYMESSSSKKQDTGSCSPGLVKHIPHVSLTLSKPHGQ